MYIFLVTLFGFVLRITNIVKPEGLWNDEYVSWFVSSTPFNQGFWQEIFKQCHMPLYYIYLKPFAFFGDTVLRLSSVIPSVLAIPVMYLVGKEYSDKCAKYSALITAILPFLIYYSQEVRLYSLVFLLSALILLFLIRTIKNPERKNLILYGIFSLFLVFTHVLGIIYVSLTALYLIYKTKLISKKTLLVLIILFLLILPFGLNILRQSPSAQWWGVFSYTNILFLFSDFLSPILSNHINAPPVFFYKTGVVFACLITIPTLIGLLGIIRGFKKVRGFAFILLIFVLTITALAISGKIVFITKYLIEILPIIIFAIVLGAEDTKRFGTILLYIFVFINLFSIFTPYYPAKQFRSEGNKLPASILNNQNPDYVVFTYYAPDRFIRYLTIEPKMSHISKINRFEHLGNPSVIMNELKSGEKVSIVFLDSVSFIPADMLKGAEEKKLPEMFITFSKIRLNLEKYALSNLNNITVLKSGSWTIVNGIKK